MLNPEILYNILMQVSEKKKMPPAIESVPVLSRKKPVTIAEKIIAVIRRLYKNGSADFISLLNNNNNNFEISEIVATFAAVLELLKNNRIIIIGEDLLECRFVLNREKSAI